MSSAVVLLKPGRHHAPACRGIVSYRMMESHLRHCHIIHIWFCALCHDFVEVTDPMKDRARAVDTKVMMKIVQTAKMR